MDFLLLDLYLEIILGMEFYYMGWDCLGILLDIVVIVYYFCGDIQKFVYFINEVIVFINLIQWSNGVVMLFNQYYRLCYMDGIIEIGFLGVVLFDKNYWVVVQFYGDVGVIICDNVLVYFGCLFMVWEGFGLDFCFKDWLDFFGMDMMMMDVFGVFCLVLVIIDDDEVVVGVQVSFYVDDVLMVIIEMGVDGCILILEGLFFFGDIILMFDKINLFNNGVMIFDFIRM